MRLRYDVVSGALPYSAPRVTEDDDGIRPVHGLLVLDKPGGVTRRRGSTSCSAASAQDEDRHTARSTRWRPRFSHLPRPRHASGPNMFRPAEDVPPHVLLGATSDTDDADGTITLHPIGSNPDEETGPPGARWFFSGRSTRCRRCFGGEDRGDARLRLPATGDVDLKPGG